MRLVDIDSLKGCAIIRPTSSEEIAYIQACPGLIAHKDIPTAYDVEAVVAELGCASYQTESTFDEDGYCNDDSEDVVELNTAIEIVRGKE